MDQPPSDARSGVSRRAFIKGVIASGAVASSAAYLFRGNGETIFSTRTIYQDTDNTYDPGGRLGQLMFRINW